MDMQQLREYIKEDLQEVRSSIDNLLVKEYRAGQSAMALNDDKELEYLKGKAEALKSISILIAKSLKQQ